MTETTTTTTPTRDEILKMVKLMRGYRTAGDDFATAFTRLRQDYGRHPSWLEQAFEKGWRLDTGEERNVSDLETCRQCQQLFDPNEGGTADENRCRSCVESRCKRCGGPFGGKAIIRPALLHGELRQQWLCDLTGVPISFAQAMRQQFCLCRSCTDLRCRSCGEGSVEPPDTQCDYCREPDEDEEESTWEAHDKEEYGEAEDANRAVVPAKEPLAPEPAMAALVVTGVAPVIERQNVGWVYVLSNPTMQGYIKVGFTDRDPETRARELYEGNTSVAAPYVVEYAVQVEDARVRERRVHKRLKAYRTTRKREFFTCSVEEAIVAIRWIVKDQALEVFVTAKMRAAEVARIEAEAAAVRVAAIKARDVEAAEAALRALKPFNGQPIKREIATFLPPNRQEWFIVAYERMTIIKNAIYRRSNGKEGVLLVLAHTEANIRFFEESKRHKDVPLDVAWVERENSDYFEGRERTPIADVPVENVEQSVQALQQLKREFDERKERHRREAEEREQQERKKQEHFEREQRAAKVAKEAWIADAPRREQRRKIWLAVTCVVLAAIALSVGSCVN
jgi:hypothetical protein